MSIQSSPDNMIKVDEFAKTKGLDPDKVVKMIKDGFYVGRVVDDQWYVDPSELSGASTTTNGKAAATYRSEYETARKVSIFISLLGCLVFACGVIVALVGMAGGMQSGYGGGVSILAIVPGLGIAVSGLFLVAAGQVTRATVDNADHTREILNLIRDKV